MCYFHTFSSYVAFFSSMDSKKEKTVDGWWINFLYCCAMSIGRPRPPAPLLPDLLLASPSPGGALPPEHPGRSQPPLQAVQRHHPRPFIASSTLDPTPTLGVSVIEWVSVQLELSVHVSLAVVAGLQVHSDVPIHACSAAPLNHLFILFVPTTLDA